jgi:hypothetical protein
MSTSQGKHAFRESLFKNRTTVMLCREYGVSATDPLRPASQVFTFGHRW